jgi:GNAT superfamily N-acetyltransferase
MDPQVRRILADDWYRYRELRLEALKDSPLAFVEQYDDAATRGDRYWQERVERSATGSTACTFVAIHAGTFIGKASCFVEPDITEYVSAHVGGVYVTPRFRGRSIAEALMMVVLRWARGSWRRPYPAVRHGSQRPGSRLLPAGRIRPYRHDHGLPAKPCFHRERDGVSAERLTHPHPHPHRDGTSRR